MFLVGTNTSPNVQLPLVKREPSVVKSQATSDPKAAVAKTPVNKTANNPLTQRRQGAKTRKEHLLCSLCALCDFAPLRGVLLLVQGFFTASRRCLRHPANSPGKELSRDSASAIACYSGEYPSQQFDDWITNGTEESVFVSCLLRPAQKASANLPPGRAQKAGAYLERTEKQMGFTPSNGGGGSPANRAGKFP